MNFKKFSTSDNQWYDVPYYQHKTATDTLSLPAVIYPNDTSVTVGIKGNTTQSGTPSPQSPVEVNGVGERTAQLWDISSWDGATAQRGTLERVTNGYKLTATSDDAYTMTYGSGAYSYSVIGDSEYTLSWTVDNPQIYGVIYIFTGTSVADTPLTTAVASSGSKTFTVPSGHNYVAFRLGASNAGDEITYTNIMLNTGSTALPYEPFGYKIPILLNSQTINKYLGEVQTTRYVRKLVLDGTEDWKKRAYNDTIHTFEFSWGSRIIRGLCSHYAGYLSTNIDKVDGVYLSNTTVIIITDLRFTTPTDFKAFLAAQYAAGTPVTVWYVLSSATTAIVNEPLMKIDTYADSLTTSIPCTAGENTLDVQTTVQPSEVTAEFSGWHPVQSAHERDNGQWD